MTQDLIEIYASGGQKLAASVRGLTQADLLAFPVPGTWSIQQIIIHLKDSELIAIDRMQRMIAEDNPLLLGYNETKFAGSLAYDKQSAEVAVTLFDLARKEFTKVLRTLPEAAFQRRGIHNERGEVKLGSYLEHMIEHLDHHLKFIQDKRARLGKPL